MQNPNAMAALASSQAAVAVEQLASTYLNASVGPFWSQEIMAAVVVAVLYIGRHGLKAALGKALSTAKAVWAPPKAKPEHGAPTQFDAQGNPVAYSPPAA